MEIQQRHDDAFDVEVVTNKFFTQYRQIFEKVERLIQPTLRDSDRRRLFTQKLFNRLMFIAFIQKKGWLKLNGRTDYLSALWQDYQQDNGTTNKKFYRDRLEKRGITESITLNGQHYGVEIKGRVLITFQRKD